ncbi:MAG: sulfatase, partial [Alphaproteobacteria bacterium]
ATPQCCPSRAALLTGRSGHQRANGVTSNLANDPEHTAPGITFFGLPVSDLAAGTSTIATDMNRAGYSTGFIGKAHLGGDPRLWDFRDVPVWLPKLGAPHEGATLMVNGTPQVLPGLTNQIFIDAAADWMERHRSDRWFLWLATTAPHDPLRHDPRFPYATSEIAPPPLWPEGLPLTAGFDWAGYYSTISMLDDDLGRLFSRMRDLGLDRNTVVFFLSDNGQMAGSHGPEDDVSTKSVWFEESARVPGVVRWPGVIPAGSVVDAPLVSVDVTATIRSLAGLPRDPGTEGMDMIPALVGRTPLRQTAYAEIWDALHEIWKWQMVREGDWKYVAFESGQELLYDLASDPDEMVDLSARPDVGATLERMRGRLAAWKSVTP